MSTEFARSAPPTSGVLAAGGITVQDVLVRPGDDNLIVATLALWTNSTALTIAVLAVLAVLTD
jgi:hypothetical protein